MTVIQNKIDKKSRRKRRRPFRERPISYVLEGLLCLLFIVGLAYGTYRFVKTSPMFKVKTIRVEGAVKLDPQAVIAASGVTSDDCLPLLSDTEIQKRVAVVPYVRTCNVSRVFPDRLVIKIQERVALATLMVNNHMYEVDEEANVLRELTPDMPTRPPFITNVPDLDVVEIGQRPDRPSLKAALAVWGAFSQTGMVHDVTVSEISAAREDRICMYCDEFKFEIRWGRDDFDKQARKLDVFWQAQNKKIQCNEYLDLRFGNDVNCK
jgi:cell division protein FtsQ